MWYIQKQRLDIQALLYRVNKNIELDTICYFFIFREQPGYTERH